MAIHPNQVDFNEGLSKLKPKSKEPNSVRILETWIMQAESALGTERGGRLSWLIASTIVCAFLQQVVTNDGASIFLLKGGTMLQHRLNMASRATKDIDGLVRGDIDDFINAMDRHVQESWGPIGFKRSEIEVIETPTKIIKPRRFDLTLMIHGKTWRKVPIEISPDEGRAGTLQDEFSAPNLDGIGLPTPDHLISLAMQYQIAQKIHAATDPHDPPVFINERARDVVDLLLLKELVEETGEPSRIQVSDAVKDIFDARSKEAEKLDRPIRTWPAKLQAYPHWQNDYKATAEQVGITLSLDEAVTEVNAWLKQLVSA